MEVAGLSGVLTGGAEGSVALAGLALFPSDCASGFSLLEVAELAVLSWTRSSGFVAGGWAAQDNKAITQTKCIVRNLQFIMRITLIMTKVSVFSVQVTAFMFLLPDT